MSSETPFILGLPASASSLFASLYKTPLLPEAVLQERLDNHISSLHQQAAHNSIPNLELADMIYERCVDLLKSVDPQKAHACHLVQAAILYFIIDNDSDHDTTSATGLDDDAAVLVSVQEYLESHK